MPEVVGSNLSLDAGYPNWGILWFSPSIQAHFRIVPSLDHDRLPPCPSQFLTYQSPQHSTSLSKSHTRDTVKHKLTSPSVWLILRPKLNEELKNIWKTAVRDLIEALSRHLLGRAEEYRENLSQDGQRSARNSNRTPLVHRSRAILQR